MLFSIVVPVYNAEKYLKNTIESVLSQSFTDWELIIVDDGSKDRSLEICGEYWQADSRIKLISQENMGVSAARNTGITAAQGEYIMFLDSDDEYLPGAFAAVADTINKTGADLIVSSSKVVDVDTGKLLHEWDYVLPEYFDSIEDFYYQMRLIRIAPAPWRYAVKRQIIHSNFILFPKGVTVAEDCLWLCRMLGFIDNPAYNSHAFYKYSVHSNSAMSTINFSKLQDIMFVCEELFKLQRNLDGELKKLVFSYCNILFNTLLQHYPQQAKHNKKFIRQWAKRHSADFSKTFSVRPVLKYTSAIMGIWNSMFVFAYLTKIKIGFVKMRAVRSK